MNAMTDTAATGETYITMTGAASFVPPPYPYDRLDELLAVAAAHDGGVIDLSIGTPCDPPPAAVVEALGHSDTERGYPPSVREIGQAVGLTSPSTVHSHLATLQRRGYLHRDPTKPRAIEVRYDPNSGAGEDGIERCGELGVPVPDQEPVAVRVVAEVKEQVPRGLSDPVAGRVGGDTR